MALNNRNQLVLGIIWSRISSLLLIAISILAHCQVAKATSPDCGCKSVSGKANLVQLAQLAQELPSQVEKEAKDVRPGYGMNLLNRDEILAKFPLGTEREFGLSPEKVVLYDDGKGVQQKFPPERCSASIRRSKEEPDYLTFMLFGSQKIPDGVEVPFAGSGYGTYISDKKLPFAQDTEIKSLSGTAEYKDGILRTQSISQAPDGKYRVLEMEFEVAPDLSSISRGTQREWVGLNHPEDRSKVEAKTMVYCSSMVY
jgi:hypothetical protein